LKRQPGFLTVRGYLKRIINPYISVIAAVGFLHCWFIVEYPEPDPKNEGESNESERLTNRKEETISSIVRD